MYSNKLICDILSYIDINLNSKITIEDISKKFYYNRYYIMKLFKKEIDITISEYINLLRINNAMKEIKDTNNSYTLVSLNNGFYSLEYFSETFKKIVGISPRVYKKFWLPYSNISDKEKSIIINSITSIKILIDKVEKYRHNLKPHVFPVRKLSIFK